MVFKTFFYVGGFVSFWFFTTVLSKTKTLDESEFPPQLISVSLSLSVVLVSRAKQRLGSITDFSSSSLRCVCERRGGECGHVTSSFCSFSP